MSPLLSAFIVVLYLFAVPYIGLMLLVIVGFFRERPRPHSTATPSVSVIIPAHNEADIIAANLESLAKQHYQGGLEFVIVNDRSSDATAEILERFAAQDPRFKVVHVTTPSRRLSPKVNAVNSGITASSGEIILTSDADCSYPTTWVEGMVSHFEDDVAMVVGYVESSQRGKPMRLLTRLESIDWLSLMLVAMSLANFGWKVAGSANNQAYRRSAFLSIGGFGASGRAPSGDEDLLIQRMGRRQRGRVVFAKDAATRVLTQPTPNLGGLLKQRRRWVSRYRHAIHYHPAFWLSIATLGTQSVLLATAAPLALALPPLRLPVFALWGAKLLVELTGMALGTRLIGRRDLFGASTLLWALAHPFFIATVAVLALARSGEWHAGARGYRRRFIRRQWREFKRRVRQTV